MMIIAFSSPVTSLDVGSQPSLVLRQLLPSKEWSLVEHLKWVELEERPSYLGIGSNLMPLSPI